jgi:hypothetical protein
MLGRRKNIFFLFVGVSCFLFFLLTYYFHFYNSNELLFQFSSINATLANENGKSPSFNAITAKLPNDDQITAVDDEFDSKKLAELNQHIWRSIQWDHPGKRRMVG